jgi:peroxiredoxin Q/BCP
VEEERAMKNFGKKLFGFFAVATLAVSLNIFAAAPSHAKDADVGSVAPAFTTQGALAGKVFTFNLTEELKKGPVVLYFFPKVFTKGCTAEAHEFAEKHDEFAKLGATVIGLSGDKIDEISKFSVSECRNKFAVGQANSKIIKEYGVAFGPVASMSNRTSFVIAQDGKIVLRHTDLNYVGHVDQTLAAVKKLATQ